MSRAKGRINRLQGWLARRSGTTLGAWGEWVALGYLLTAGFDVIARNWRIGRGEVDLIAYEGPFLVFVEVKTRKGTGMLPPELNVSDEKKEQLDFLAQSFLARHELTDTGVRFDLVAIETPDQVDYEIRHYRGFM